MSLFIDGYIEAMFFTNAGPDDEIPSNAELSEDARKTIAIDCHNFMNLAVFELDEAYIDGSYSEAQAGRDFWYTRNGHGVGFWSRDELPDGLGESLTEIANRFPECSMYLGDDGLVYLA